MKVQILLDTINDRGYRLTTYRLRYPRYIHPEMLTHRALSRNSSSSRAIPAKKVRESVRDDPAIPAEFGKEQRGMQAKELFSDRKAEDAERWWLGGMYSMLHVHQLGESFGLHKQIVNRVLEPWSCIDTLVSATEWENFFRLRTHETTDPTFRRLALEMERQYFQSMPVRADIHLPLVTKTDVDVMKRDYGLECDWHGGPFPVVVNVDGVPIQINTQVELALYRLKIQSVARCARVSYGNHLNKSTREADQRLYEKLEGNGHLSPFEHVATAGQCDKYANFRGWRQLRHIIEIQRDTYRCLKCGTWDKQRHVTGCQY